MPSHFPLEDKCCGSFNFLLGTFRALYLICLFLIKRYPGCCQRRGFMISAENSDNNSRTTSEICNFYPVKDSVYGWDSRNILTSSISDKNKMTITNQKFILVL